MPEDPQETPRRFVRLGVDVGDVRVGLARSDLDGLLATPVETLPRDGAVAGVVSHARELEARAIMVGLPRSLSGQEGPAAAKARAFADELADALQAQGVEAEIRFVDERLTTVTAHQALHRSGRKGRRHRSVVDQVAAVMILQQALEVERSTGRAPGELLETAPDTEGEGR
ncbi:Holliday junction resolvase RuvX [Brachybacterium halotolerans subsp. kimchii]|uniref:Holliday junction resolvase RuvX n=1 Tax=Brachybacterium halotolerans TaxID=2795215 RepID=UPI001E3D335A|nr:Holliday junction resolvase RuvX [Brachybacterium halotolerans]UEJ83147.1 Holliday junction resolvase RuvX [Brachybacterium halotolerans subsp. kimchii]